MHLVRCNRSFHETRPHRPDALIRTSFAGFLPLTIGRHRIRTVGRGWSSWDMQRTAHGRSTYFVVNPCCYGRIGCWWSWTTTPAGSLALASMLALSTVRRCVACSKQAIRGVTSFPRYLSSDHDPLFRFHQWEANLRVLNITGIKTVLKFPGRIRSSKD